ncbi:MAG: 30S ribosome-binding factor RbfA [Anaerolineae bacterium]|nr:30S ribosome-binding factor RbfA [Anaerolineae bacterium]
MPTRRQRQVAELVHRELALLLLREVRDPRLEGVTITEVRVTPDLLLARIFFTLLDDDAPGPSTTRSVAEAKSALEHATGFLRSQLGARVRLRLVPDLVFMHDTSAAYGQHIDALLDQIAEEETARDRGGPDDEQALRDGVSSDGEDVQEDRSA